MNTTPAQQVIDAVDRDASVIQLRAKFADFERRLQNIQDEIADDIALLNETAKRNQATERAMSNEDRLAVIEAGTKPTRSIESMRDHIRERRMAESECAEGLRIIRIMLRQREDVAYYAAFKQFLSTQQVAIGGRALDRMIEMAELWHEECKLRAPLP
jgi:hypothetical protein